jgi:hypothetical protein
LTPGERLVAQTARLAPDPAELQAALSASPDWQDTVELLAYHRLRARAHRCLQPWRDRLPSEARRSLALAAAECWGMNATVARSGSAVLAALARDGLAAIPLKGPWIAERLHHPPHTRPTHDLDLLVRREDLTAVASVLRDLGYVQVPNPTAPATEHHVYVSERSTPWLPRIDVHCHITGAGDEPWLDRLWGRVVAQPFRGSTVSALSGADLLLYLSVHSARHGWLHLCHFLDLAQALDAEGPTLDWEELEREAGGVSMTGALRLSLSVAVHVCYARPPPGPLASWSPRTAVGELMLRRRGLVRLRPGLREGPYQTVLQALVDDGARRGLHRLRDATWPSGPPRQTRSGRARMTRAARRAARLARQLTIAFS